MVTIRDVAREVGVSITTVSHALNGKGSVSPDTRRRILEAAARLEYAPNTTARSLVKRQTNAVGIAYPVPDLVASSSTTLGVFVSALADRLNHWGYNTLLATRSYDDRDKFLQLVASQTVDGMVVLDVRNHDYRVPLLRKFKMPFVLMGRCLDNEGLDYVDIDAEQGAYEATKALIAVGHRRIVYHGAADLDMGYTHRGLIGYQRALAEAALPFQNALVRIQAPVPRALALLAQGLAADGTAYTAVVTGSLSLERNLGAAEDGFGPGSSDIQIAAYGTDRIFDMAGLAVDRLVAVMKSQSQDMMQRLFPTKVKVY